ncbi:hypothetical protein BDP81DRAFT_453349 [Colletotrichum phormii]|uniref:Uncharacterized protein n=1 Tax=Colletotrichum phormii TaxID=359342 RepID=A0AAI9ZHB6_9PEZI|nr:uncharacterized protein BDP81DRAFT_453349 [Colletotrichum phormii]KAK1624593.1 hypothetical protein BDP81DRAFT_453349 [Colletotrichum phormii]
MGLVGELLNGRTATGLTQPSAFKMASLGTLSSGIKPEDTPIPSREPSREFSLPFRPSPAPPNRSPSWAFEKTPGPNNGPKKTVIDPDLLRVQKYLKFPGLDMPEVVITEQNRGFVTVLSLDRDLLVPGSSDLPVAPDSMQSFVCYKVEHLFATVFGVLYANKDMVMDWRQAWNKVQRLLAKENQVWKTDVTANKIRDLVQQFADARINYLENAPNSRLPRLGDRQNCRLLKSIDRYIDFKADRSSVSDLLQFPAKHRWMNRHRVRRYHRHQDAGPAHPAPAPPALMSPMASTAPMLSPEAIVALIATPPSFYGGRR